jgi:8-oxo-dGTP diphosphatase
MSSEDRKYPTRPIVGVAAVVIVDADVRPTLGIATELSSRGVVLIKRRFEPMAGEWSLPGGTLEVGETLEAAIAREVAEETGLAVDVGPVVEVFDRIVLDAARKVQFHYVMIDYLCRAVGGRLTHGSDASDAIVADPAALELYRLNDKAVSVVARALTMARDWPAAYPTSP